MEEGKCLATSWVSHSIYHTGTLRLFFGLFWSRTSPLGQGLAKAVTCYRPAMSMAEGKEALETEAELSRGQATYAVVKD